MTSHTDKELLILAAKAAGIEKRTDFDGSEYFHYEIDESTYKHWNPLTDDGDALRLAVKLDMIIDVRGNHSAVAVWPDVVEPIDKDPYAATRRAIVRAAAAIGSKL